MHGAGLRVESCAGARWAWRSFSFVERFALAFEIEFLFECGFQTRVDALLPHFAKATALEAPAMWRVVGKETRVEFLKRLPAVRARVLGAEDRPFPLRIHCADGAASDGKRALHQLLDALPLLALYARRRVFSNEHLDGVLAETLQLFKIGDLHEPSIHQQRVEALTLRPLRNVGVKAFPCFDECSENFHAPAFHHRLNASRDRRRGLALDCAAAVGAVLHAEFGKKQTQKVIDLGDCGDGAFSSAASDALLDGHARRQPGDAIHVGFFELLNELPRVWRHDIEKTPLSFGEEQIEGECALS